MAKRLGSDSTGDRQGPQAAPAAAWDFQSILAIADALPMPIAYLDTERRYRFVNKALADFFERPRSEILGATMAASAWTTRSVLPSCWRAMTASCRNSRKRKWPAKKAS